MAGSEVLALAVGDTLTAAGKDLNDIESVQYLAGTFNMDEPGRVTFDVIICGATASEVDGHRAAVERLFSLAAANRFGTSGTWVTLMRNFGFGLRLFDVVGGRFTGWRRQQGSQVIYYATLEVDCLPALRGAKITKSGATALGGTDTQWLETNVPGDLDALVQVTFTDTSLNGAVVNGLTFYRAAADELTGADFQAFIDGTPADGASSVSDTGSMGGAFIRRALTDATTPWAIASVTPPAKAFNKGTFDVFARVRSTPEVLAAPTLTALAKTDAVRIGEDVVTETADEEPELLFVDRYTVTVNDFDDGDIETLAFPTVSGSTSIDGSPKVVFITRARFNGTEEGMARPEAGSNWARVGVIGVNDWVIDPAFIYYHAGTNSLPLMQYWTSSGDPLEDEPSEVDVLVFALLGAASAPFEHLVSAQWMADDTLGMNWTFDLGRQTLGPGRLAVIAVLADNGFDAGSGDYEQRSPTVTFSSDGYTPLYGGEEESLARAPEGGPSERWFIASRAYESAEVTPTVTLAKMDTEQDLRVAYFTLRPDTTIVVEPSDQFQEPTPGDLPAGEHTFRVQPIDSAGHLGEVSNELSITTTVPNAAVTLTFTAPANGTPLNYRIYWEFEDKLYYVHTPDNSLTYVFKNSANASRPSANVVEESQRTPNQVRFSYSMGGLVWDEGRWFDVPLATGDIFQWVLLGQFELPPREASLVGERAPWLGQVEGINGGGVAVDMDVDCVVTVPANEVTARVSFPVVTLSEQATWHIDSHRTGKSLVAWLTEKSTDTFLEGLAHAGTLLAAPGDNLFGWFGIDETGEANVSDLRGDLTLEIYPRYTW